MFEIDIKQNVNRDTSVQSPFYIKLLLKFDYQFLGVR